MHIGRGQRANRQGVQLVESNTMGGGVDGVSTMLGTTGDMPFVGSRTRARADGVQKERAAEMSVQGLFNGGSRDHHVPRRRRRSHDVDVRRDRDDRENHGGRGMVGHDDQRGWSRDERDGVVVLSVGGAKMRSISGGPEQLGGFVDVLTRAYVSRNNRTSRQRISPSTNQCCVVSTRVEMYGQGLWVGCPTEA